MKKRTKGAWKKSRQKDPRVKGQQLPGGLVNAVAQFVGFTMDENDDGVPFISLRGVTKEPEEQAGIPARVTHRFVETDRKTVADVCDEFASDLNLLGADLEGVDEDGWEDVLKQLAEDKPHFCFNTRAWEFNGRSGVSVFIQGIAEDFDGGEDADDDTETSSSTDDDDADEDAADDDDDATADDDAGDDTGDTDADDAADWKPEKEEVYMFRPTARSKKQEWEVTSVNQKMKTVGLKRVSDGKTAKNVKWDKLEGPDED